MNETRNSARSAAARRRITEQAASWYLDHRDGLDDDRRADFLAWLRHSPVHVAEYLAIAGLHDDLKAAAAMETMSIDQLDALAATESPVVPLHRDMPAPFAATRSRAAARPPRRHSMHLMMAGVVGLLFAGAAMWQVLAISSTDVYTSRADAGRELTLADGSRLQLDRDSTVAVHFDTWQRSIEIRHGGALIDVGKDPSRPLQVTLGASVLRDVGTVFEARRRGDGGTVTVISGQVDVLAPGSTWCAAWLNLLGCHAHAGRVVAKLAGGEQASVNGAGAITARSAQADIAQVTAWLPPEIRFQRSTVAEVARRFNAYTAHPLVIEDPALASMRISGLFHAHDVDAFVTYLASLPGVHVQREDERIRILGPKAQIPPSVHRL